MNTPVTGRLRALFLVFCAATVLAASTAPAAERGLRARLQEAREASRQERPVAVPTGATAIRNVAYGSDPAQRFDVYLPANARNAPVLFYVHGGGWANGDKTNPGMEVKLAWWLPRGYAVISSNYRMVPVAKPLEQARDVARAVAAAQRHAGEWKIDPKRFVLMGHSAGAHLVALLGAEPKLLAGAGAQRPLGIVSLDSGALDVEALMSGPRVPRLYENAFGDDRGYWASTSPIEQLSRDSLPMLVVCSSVRRFPTSPCDEGRRFAGKAGALGVGVQVLPEAMTHGELNHDLGAPSAYTTAVSNYIDALTGHSSGRPSPAAGSPPSPG